ncbi:uncharacterized protein LOC129593006 [Paramacrobiotus metropolitanus]|uniref:uncharacterized protein LOC129593006 n=1 Tax=Paramacrobiotus metropolitanus TaxID=2943436 RepID=UPI0024459959|nr:uncharacterized protein LOC129593006 [Paramacrobiotus metropolitanus]
MRPFQILVQCVVLLDFLHHSVGKRKGGEVIHDKSGMFSPLPAFNTELMTRDQCELQFTAHCGVRSNVGNSFACAQNQGLAVNCSSEASNDEVRHLAIALSKPPLKAVFISLNDGPQIAFENLAPVREQTVVFQLHNCRLPRATKKLAQLRLPHLLEFSAHHCRALDVRRADFWQSGKLRLIQFHNSTIEFLEEGTFADLPGLRLLSLERGLSEIMEYPEDIRSYIVRLHCGCEFKSFRRWFSASRLMRYANEGQIYRIEYDAWRNEDLGYDNVVLPIDCTEAAFPNQTLFIRSSLDSFSVNEDLYNETFPERCDKDTNDMFPTFWSEPMTENECRVRELIECSCLLRSYRRCEEQWPRGSFSSRTNCTHAEEVNEIRQLAKALAQQPPRPTVWTIADSVPITTADVAPIRRTIVRFDLFRCTSSRSTTKASDLQLTSLLDYCISDCSDLDVQRDDFQLLPKLRLLIFSNTTIHSLHIGAFSYLSELRLLSLEHGISSIGVPRRALRFVTSHLDFRTNHTFS